MVSEMKEHKKRKKNHGFTLVEVLVAAAILSVMVTPILSSFVAIARVNAKARRRLSATTIANGVMESVKGFSLADVSKQCNNSASGFHVIAGFTGTASEIGGASYSGGTFTPKDSGVYEFSMVGVVMDGTTYDVRLKYTKNETNTKAAVTGVLDAHGAEIAGLTTENILGPMEVRLLTYYDVEIKVYNGGAGTSSTPLAVITGSKADYTMATPTGD